MSQLIQKLFLQHPASVEETYWQHATFAFSFSTKLLVAALAALIHSIVPALFEKTASKIIAELYHRTHNRGR